MDGLVMKYFVLKPKGRSVYAAASRVAMLAYADEIEKLNPKLAGQLRDWAIVELDIANEWVESVSNGTCRLEK